MSRDEAEAMVFDLIDAARAFDRSEIGSQMYAREHYKEMLAKVLDALTTSPPSAKDNP